MRIAHSAIYAHPLPKQHRFPMDKYDLVPQQLLLEGTIQANQLIQPKRIELDYVRACHTEEWIQTLLKGTLSKQSERKTGFPYSVELVERELYIMEGTRIAIDWAFEDGIAFNMAGGTHHAYTSFGSGFCLFNDLAIAAFYAIASGKAKRVLILDLDVHQGDGTAEICSANSSIYTVSIHGKENFPLQKMQSDWDIPLETGTSGKAYLSVLQGVLDKLQTEEFDCMLYQCGVDILDTDALGKLQVSLADCKERDSMVLEWARKRELPIVATMGGGYSPQIKHIIEAHSNTYRIANQVFG